MASSSANKNGNATNSGSSPPPPTSPPFLSFSLYTSLFFLRLLCIHFLYIRLIWIGLSCSIHIFCSLPDTTTPSMHTAAKPTISHNFIYANHSLVRSERCVENITSILCSNFEICRSGYILWNMCLLCLQGPRGSVYICHVLTTLLWSVCLQYFGSQAAWWLRS